MMKCEGKIKKLRNNVKIIPGVTEGVQNDWISNKKKKEISYKGKKKKATLGQVYKVNLYVYKVIFDKKKTSLGYPYLE